MIDPGIISLVGVIILGAFTYFGSRSKVPVQTVALLQVQIKMLEFRISTLENERTHAERRVSDKDAIIAKLESDIERLRAERDEAVRSLAIAIGKKITP